MLFKQFLVLPGTDIALFRTDGHSRAPVFREQLDDLGHDPLDGRVRLRAAPDAFSIEAIDGNADVARLRLVTIDPESPVLVIPVEDVIADRLGQYVANPAGSRALLRQAVLAWSLADEIDRAYLDARIRTETIDTLDLARFEELVAREDDHP